jgi:hypothetical protein
MLGMSPWVMTPTRLQKQNKKQKEKTAKPDAGSPE